jgi:hypothetical protein
MGSAATLITALIGVSTYFIQKWIANVDDHIKENSSEIQSVKEEVADIKAEQKLQGRNIPSTIRDELRAYGDRPNSDTAAIKKDVEEIKALASRPPQVPPELKGKLILIQERQDASDKKVETLYNTVKIIVDRLRPK